jgi:hypothetical protein
MVTVSTEQRQGHVRNGRYREGRASHRTVTDFGIFPSNLYLL